MSLQRAFQRVKDDLVQMSVQLYNNPELGDEEFESMKLLVNYLQSYNFNVETNIVNRPTAFRAEYNSQKAGPTVAFLAEYDALPHIGHGCGHNLIAVMSVGAGVVLRQLIDEIGGRVIVLGTPAEETNGAKVPMSEQGIFDEIDVAMMVHPSGISMESGTSLAMDAIQFDYFGKSSHAAGAPEEGINALDSVIQLFNGINALREHVSDDVRMHGIISEGGQAANIVPEKATAQFYFRAESRNVLNDVVEKAKHIANGAAQMTGATLKISNYELSYDNMITNKILSNAFTKNLQNISNEQVHPHKGAGGSLDMGNVSQVVPSIHPYVSLNKPDLVAHTKEFADQTVTKDGEQAIEKAVLALAQTGYDVIADEQLFKQIQEEFSKNSL